MSLLLPAPSTIHRFDGTLDGVIARCASVADAAAALAHAREYGLELGSELVIDLSALDAVHVDPVRRIAWVQPGATWRRLDAAAQDDGLAVTGARLAGTPVVDAVLGSGGGWLERRLGLPADNLRAARVLTAGGRVVTASSHENADLFWALRGGDASPGIVIELELALRPVGPAVLGGMLLWGRDRAPDVVRAYRDLMAEAPDALCGGLLLYGASVSIMVVYAGAPERGAEHIAPLRALGPLVDAVRPMDYCAVQALMDRDAGAPVYLDALGDDAIDALLMEADTAIVRPLGGAVARVGEMETAAGHRCATWAVSGAGLEHWARAESPERRERLAEVKRTWDPEAVF